MQVRDLIDELKRYEPEAEVVKGIDQWQNPQSILRVKRDTTTGRNLIVLVSANEN